MQGQFAASTAELLAAHAALKESESKFRLVLENSRDAIYQLNLITLTYDYVSPSVLQMLGYTAEEFIAGGVPMVTTLTHPDDLERLRAHIERVLAHTLEDQFTSLIEYRFRTRHRGWRWISDTRTIIYAEKGSPVGMVGNIRDVTEQKETEARLRQLSARLLSIQDEERRRFARDLHDSTAQNLGALRISLDRLVQTATNLGEGERRLVAEAQSLAEECLREIRTISYLLHPPLLDEIGLSSAIKWFVQGFAQRCGINVSLNLPHTRLRFVADVEIALFRVVQEALTNIHRHSGSATARIDLVYGSADIRLEIADAGKGMLIENEAKLGVGIAGMKERLFQLGGTFEIDSGPTGTSVVASLPLHSCLREDAA